MSSTVGGPSRTLSVDEIRGFIAEQVGRLDVSGRSVCLIVPDGTRTCPLPLLLDAVYSALDGRASRLTALIALGTHPAMTQERLAGHLGYPVGQSAQRYPGLTVVNHEWWDPRTFVTVGRIGADRLSELSEDRLRRDVEVRINRIVVDHDLTLTVGPVFPHEVVGFSGGNKYLFPGVAAPEIINVSHWLGALITSAQIIGAQGVTAVRALIDEAAALVPTERHALCVVVQPGTSRLHAATFGAPEKSWAAAAAVSSQVHVRYLEAPVRRVLSVIPSRYEDMWTAAKGFYKVEPVVADGGQVVLYAPHITQVSAMHPEITKIGYHNRDYFLKQWPRFSDHAWGDLAHSTHLRGSGSYDPTGGEHNRVAVTLATGIPESVVRSINLDYLDPAKVDPVAWAADRDTLVVPDAGEMLFRLR